jgi:L-seryl-tRNA(Ser) seleniumtransferase
MRVANHGRRQALIASVPMTDPSGDPFGDPTGHAGSDPRRALPGVDTVLAALHDSGLPHALRALAAREAIDSARADIEAGVGAAQRSPSRDEVLSDARERAARMSQRLLVPVINATGVLLHTNLGRAPLGEDAIAALVGAAGALNLEFRLDEGERGSRHDHTGFLLAAATGAEAGLVVNNNAGAVMLVLAALCRDREVVVSRGELVEIGGGFRVPDIMAETGARLVEVGTTNRTRRDDYQRAMGSQTAALLKVHASNYRMVGFTEATPVAELADLGPPVFVDAGSGLLDARTPWLPEAPAWLHDEPGVRQCLDEGAAIVTFSGDKLLGGPQAGIIVGRGDLVATCARHPLARALRADKLTLAALQATALAYLDGDATRIPLWHHATMPVEALRERAEAIRAHVPGTEVIDTQAAAGGGSLPGLTIPSAGLAVAVDDVEDALRWLRLSHRVVARGREGRVHCDLRSVEVRHDEYLAAALRDVGVADG